MSINKTSEDISLLTSGQSIINILDNKQFSSDISCSCHELFKDPINKSKNNLEFYAWDETKTVIIGSSSVANDSYDIISATPLPFLQIDIDDNLRQIGINQGKFLIEYFLFRKIENFVIKEISVSRKEIRAEPLNVLSEGYKALLTYRQICSDGNRNELVANFGNHNHICVTNWLTDGEASGDPIPNCGNIDAFVSDIAINDPMSDGTRNDWATIILKTYEPIPPNITVKTKFRLDLLLLEPIEKKVILYPFPDIEKCRILRSPNWSLTKNFNNKVQSIGSSNWNKLLAYDLSGSISNRLINEFLSGSNAIKLNVDYSNFENFTNFSSVEYRLRNFKSKVTDIERLNKNISDLTTNVAPISASITASTEFKNNINKFTNQRENIIGGFDDFEKYMYYESSSYITSSLGEFLDISWPKSGSIKPYTLYSYTSSLASNWFGNINDRVGIIYSASLYDRNNNNELIKTIPEHIINDLQNDQYVNFIRLMGQHFDDLWLYTKELTSIYDRKESINQGMPKELILYVLQSFGWDPQSGQSFESLWKWAFGTDENEKYQTLDSFSHPSSSINFVTSESISRKDINREIWKRIINNISYIMKSKGTKKGIQSILNCYGVPRTALNIVQWGAS